MAKVYVVIGTGPYDWYDDNSGKERNILGVYPSEKVARERIASLLSRQVYQGFYNSREPTPGGEGYTCFSYAEEFRIEEREIPWTRIPEDFLNPKENSVSGDIISFERFIVDITMHITEIPKNTLPHYK